ncbi:MAG: hypothetical protein ACRDGT_10015 [Candidatus Limnocylindria bacterium]
MGTVAAIATVAAVLVAAAIVGQQFAGRDAGTQPSPSPAASSTPVAAASATPTPSPIPSTSPLPPGTFENPILGYRITMPERYRRSLSRIVTGQEVLGDDHFTIQTEAEEREACMRDAGHIPTVREPPDISVSVYRDPGGITADAWAKTPRTPGAQPLSHHHNVEAFTVGEYEAVKLVQDNASVATSAVVIRANGRFYEIRYSGAWSPWSLSMKTYLDDIAKSFIAVPPGAFPSPTPTTEPQAAAREVADSLSRAFAARDADAVRRLMPECWIGFAYAIDGVVPGQGGNNRSVHLFTERLRERFGAGTLSVTVDPTLQVVTDAGGTRYYLRSDWREPDRTIRIDLYLDGSGGRWLWRSAIHHFASGSCISYRSPWVSGAGSC